MMKIFQIYFFVNLIFVCMSFFHGNCASVLSARCRSRCFAQQEIKRQNITTNHVSCDTHACLACLKPCGEKKTTVLSCSALCGLHFTLEQKRICRASCKFIKHTHLEDGNLTCPVGVPNSECVLMTPENVQVSVPERNRKAQNYTISWNGTWPSSTEFVVMAKQQQKGLSSDADTTHDWTEIAQTNLQSVKVDLAPLFWYQFKVAAANQYGASFSVPSRFVFANPLRPGPPRGFRVTSMQMAKGHVQVGVAWKKPVSSIGLPIHRYRLSWSMRPDEQLDKYISLKVTDKRLKGNIHEYTIGELLSNSTYVLEIQAISRWREQRLRSRRVTLRIRTTVLEEDHVQRKSLLKTKVHSVIKGNAFFTKTASEDSTVEVFTKPTTMKETNPKDHRSTGLSTALTPSTADVSPDIETQKSIAGVNRISWFTLNTLLALATILICYLM